MRPALVLALFVGCAAERPQPVELPPQPTASAAAPVNVALSRSVTRPSDAHACLMLYECGCNAGCTTIDRAPDALQVGAQAHVLSGPLKGGVVFVVKNRTSEGDSVFTVQREDPNAAIHVCGELRSPLVGYGCSVKDSGMARACTSCD